MDFLLGECFRRGGRSPPQLWLFWSSVASIPDCDLCCSPLLLFICSWSSCCSPYHLHVVHEATSCQMVQAGYNFCPHRYNFCNHLVDCTKLRWWKVVNRSTHPLGETCHYKLINEPYPYPFFFFLIHSDCTRSGRIYVNASIKKEEGSEQMTPTSASRGTTVLK